jgi:hypothetical protein
MYLNRGNVSIAECNKTKRNSPDNSDVIDIAEGLYFAQNLLNVVFWPQSDFFYSIEALLQFVPSFDNLAITALALPMSSKSESIFGQLDYYVIRPTKNSTSSKSSLYLDLLALWCKDLAS